MLHDINLKVPIELVEVPLEITVAHFVTVFKFTKVFTLLLNGVVGQMDKFVVKIIQTEFSTTCPDVTILIEVCLELLID